MLKILDKIYYNTGYRKKIKALSKFNIYVKDRISRKDIIYDKKIEKLKCFSIFLIDKTKDNYLIYKLIKNKYDNIFYKKDYNLKIVFTFLKIYLNKFLKKKDIYVGLINQLSIIYLKSSIAYFFLIVNYI
jgi:hypothetical protein